MFNRLSSSSGADRLNAIHPSFFFMHTPFSPSETDIRPLELLSPAKNLECGIAAIDHGADAVYIGASQFGARAAAGNTVEDIARLCDYAHRFRVRVFVALNTVLTDDQLADAEKLIWDIYRAGADALIIQDMGVTKLNLPPIALHASTQTDNRSVEKVRFLQDAGFSRVVLARELSQQEVGCIARATDVELEAFVHGALCVSYSGQCYMSQAMCGRSANRGQCAQYCRLPYDLLDADGQVLQMRKHLLSLKDLDQSASLAEMAEAGVMSFKIEGRLKDVDYVTNITAYYRRKLDELIASNPRYRRASAGRTTFFFEPNPEKSFRRNATDYFLHGRHAGMIQPDTPKSLGEYIGKVTFVGKGFFELRSHQELHNGDGLCFLNRQGELTGFRLNTATLQGGKTRCVPGEMPALQVGAELYRNQDTQFEKVLKGKTSDRRVGVRLLFSETGTGFALQLTDEDGLVSRTDFAADKQPAQKPEAVQANVSNQLSKLGTTIYEALEVTVDLQGAWFFPASQLGEWRRSAVEAFELKRAEAYVRELPRPAVASAFPSKQLTYLGNVTNKLAETFYREHGVDAVASGFEVKAEKGVPLMFTRYCVKYEMGWCPKQGNPMPAREPLFLRHKEQRFRLTFDCKACEMRISQV